MMGTTLGLHVGERKQPTQIFICDRCGLLNAKSLIAQNKVLYIVAPKINYLHTEFHIFFQQLN
jgi:hypothetical protein